MHERNEAKVGHAKFNQFLKSCFSSLNKYTEIQLSTLLLTGQAIFMAWEQRGRPHLSTKYSVCSKAANKRISIKSVCYCAKNR